MPQFIPSHTPKGLDAFTVDYLSAVEWLIDDEIDRAKVRGFTKAAISQAKRDCKAFQETYAADLEAYREATGYTGGVDFWLTRNHHGAGFWDRDLGELGDRLTEAANLCGARDTDVYKGWIYLS